MIELKQAHFAIPRGMVIYAVACIPLLRFLFDWAKGLDFLLYQYLTDDAFYYFEISKHIPEFNTGIPNSGFHPLYAFLVSPLHTYLSYNLAIPLSLLLVVLFNSVGIVVLYYVLSVYWDGLIPILCAAAWAVSPQMYTISLSGVETILATTIALLFFAQFTRIQNHQLEKLHPLNFGLLGLLTGLSFLARMDTSLILAPAMLYLAFRLLRSKRAVNLAFFAAPAIALHAGWIAYMKSQTGHIFPTSAAALRVLRGIDGRLIATPESILRSVKYILNSLVDFFLIVPPGIEPILLIILLLAGLTGVLVLICDKQAPGDNSKARFSLLIAAGLGCWSLYYIFYQGGLRRWYLAHLGLVMFAVWLPSVLAVILRPQKLEVRNHRMGLQSQSHNRLWLGICIIVGIFAVLSQHNMKPLAPQEYDKYKSALAANSFIAEMDAGKNIGAFNTGIYNYFMEMDVINLDGKVNPEAMEALRNVELVDYIRRKNIGYLIEHDIGEAANLERIYEDDRLELRRWIDLTKFYPGYNGRYAKHTYLWKLEVRDE